MKYSNTSNDNQKQLINSKQKGISDASNRYESYNMQASNYPYQDIFQSKN